MIGSPRGDYGHCNTECGLCTSHVKLDCTMYEYAIGIITVAEGQKNQFGGREMSSFWLPKDERRLLAGYALQINEVGDQVKFHEGMLVKWLTCWWWKMEKLPEIDEETKTHW